jgi:hypothetical protein
MTDPQIAEIARKMTAAQRKALLKSGTFALTEKQSARGTLSNFGGDILDWSYRPARFTPLGQSVAAYLKEQSQ